MLNRLFAVIGFRSSIFVLLCNAVLSLSLSAATFNVSNVLEFQNALTTAQDNGENDTIVVAAGTYNVVTTLSFISLENYSLTIIGAGIASTILDGGNSTQIFDITSSGDDADLIIRNVSLQNGNSSADGGAMYIETEAAIIIIDSCDFNSNYAVTLGGGANAVSNSGNINISNCFFRNDTGYYNAGGLNAGVTDGNITLTNTTFEGNVVLDLIDSTSGVGGDAAGALLYMDNTGTIIATGNTFTSNISADDGGGLFTYQLGADVSVSVTYNTFTNNHAELGGGGFYGRITSSGTMNFNNNYFSGNSSIRYDGAGAHIEINTGTLDFSDNTFIDNISSESGAGAAIENDAGTSSITNNTFTNNRAASNGGGANIFTENGTVTISRNVSNSNSAENIGGGMSIATTSGTLNVFNNTFYGDSADDGGGLYLYLDQATATANIYNDIFWHCIPQAMSMSGAVAVSVQYSDIESGTGESWFGTGCIDAYPLFFDTTGGDFHLSWTNFPTDDATKSPCIDTGDPTSTHDPDSTIADMRAFFFDQLSGIVDNRSEKISDVELCKIYPNPFNSTVTIEYEIAAQCIVKIQIYDVSGQHIETLVDNYVNAGRHSIKWNAENLGSGIYFYRIETTDYKKIGKFILVK